MPTTNLKNAMTVDVEDYFQVSALAPYIPRNRWDSMECRIGRNVDRILSLFEDTGVKATFFTLGWIAKRHPSVVRAIVAQGHELASHGYGHERATDLTPHDFTTDIVRAKNLLEDIGGMEVIGYRAPSFSIGKTNAWAFARLSRVGYRYSSSVYPVHHDHYGVPDAPRFAHFVLDGFLEIPPSTVRWRSRNWPSSGGGFFRLLPYSLSRSMISRIHEQDRQPAIFYFHPWEIDPGQPRVAGVDWKTRFRHHVNIAGNEAKLRRLCRDFQWGRMDEVFGVERLPPVPVRTVEHGRAARGAGATAVAPAHAASVTSSAL